MKNPNAIIMCIQGKSVCSVFAWYGEACLWKFSPFIVQEPPWKFSMFDTFDAYVISVMSHWNHMLSCDIIWYWIHMPFTCVTLVVTMLTKTNIITSIESIKTPMLEVVAVTLGYVYSLGRIFLLLLICMLSIMIKVVYFRWLYRCRAKHSDGPG